MSIIFRRNIVFDSPRPRSVVFTLSFADAVDENVRSGVVAHSNHELRQITIGDMRHARRGTGHYSAVFDQVFGIERVCVV